MAKENLSIQIEYEKKEGGAVLKKLHGRCAELHIPAEIDGLPVIAVAENAFAAEREAPLAEIGGGAGIAKGFPAGYDYGNWGVCLFGLCRTGAGTSAGEIDGGFQADVRWLWGTAGNFPAEGGQKHRGLCVLRL